MLEFWLNFTMVVFIQFILFVAHLYYTKRLSSLPRILGLGVLIGIPMGLFSDFVLVKLLGISAYNLGTGLSFLVINAAFAYGIFTANILTLQYSRFFHFCFWIIIVVAVYEIANYFFPVWIWKFDTLSSFEFLMILLVGYFLGAVFIASISHIFGRRFLFIDNLSK